MEPRAPEIRYATTDDGVQIAYWSIGDGPPVIIVHNLSWSNATLEWRLTWFWRFFTGLAETHTVIRFDPRMAGVSGRQAPSMTTEAMCLDIDAVADVMGVESFALIGRAIMGPVVIEYAATRPERVDSLVICDAITTVSEARAAETLRGVVALTESTSAEFALGVFLQGVDDPEDRAVLHEMMTATYSQDNSGIYEAQMQWDGTPFLSRITSPTLVIQSEEPDMGDAEHARQIAAAITGTRIVTIPGGTAPYGPDPGVGLTPVLQHLGHDGGFVPRSGLKAVVFTDVVESTAYTNQVGDVTAREEVRVIESLIDQHASPHGGRVVKHLGDGSMLVFATPQAAVDFALAVQAGMSDQHLDLRIGMAVGDPVEEAGDLHGAVVNLASRVAAEAAPGAVVVSDGTKQLLVGKPYQFTLVGSRNVKGFEDPIQVYEVTSRD